MGGSGVGVHGCPGVCRVAIFEQIWIFSRKLFYPQGRIVGAGGGPEAGGSPPTNKFWAEFSGAYKWEDTAPPFPRRDY